MSRQSFLLSFMELMTMFTASVAFVTGTTSAGLAPTKPATSSLAACASYDGTTADIRDENLSSC